MFTQFLGGSSTVTSTHHFLCVNMGGKKGVTSAKQKAAEKEKDQREQTAKRNEDAEWQAAGEGKKSKAQAKKASKDEDRQDAQAKKLEARRLADEEAAALAASTKKPAAGQKVRGCALVLFGKVPFECQDECF